MIVKLINVGTKKSLEFWDANEDGEPDNNLMQFKLLEGFNGIFNLPPNRNYTVEIPFTNDNAFLGNRYEKRQILIPTRIQNDVLNKQTTISREINLTVFQDNTQLRLEILTDEVNVITQKRVIFEIKEVSCLNNPIDPRTGVFSYSFDFQLEAQDPHIYGTRKVLGLGLVGEEQFELAFPAAFEEDGGISFDNNLLKNPNDIINSGDVPMDFIVAFFGESSASWLQVGLNDFDPFDPIESEGELFVGVDNGLATQTDFNAVFTKKKRVLKEYDRQTQTGESALNDLMGDFIKLPQGTTELLFRANDEGLVDKPGCIIIYQAKYLSL